MSEPWFDCVIVGAGPAGSATATHLAREGFHVALLDRAAFPRDKPCGDCISPGANDFLVRLGVFDRIRESAAALAGWRICAPSGACFETRFDRVSTNPLQHLAFALDRRRLDSILIDAARAAGADIFDRAHVIDLADHGSFHRIHFRDGTAGTRALRGSLVIGADGLRSIVSRRTGLVGRAPRLRKLSLTAHARTIGGVTEYGELHVSHGATLGVAACEAARGDPTCNITLVVDTHRFGRDVAADPARFFLDTLRSFPGIRDRITTAPLGRILGSGPFDRPVRSVVAPGIALVGDAAGYFDPFTGQGLYQAVAAAECLADHAIRAFKTASIRQPLFGYARAHARIVNGSRRLQRLIDAVCARPALMDRAVRALNGAPLAAERLAGVTGDVLPLRCLLSPKVVSSFLTRFLTAETHSAYDR